MPEPDIELYRLIIADGDVVVRNGLAEYLRDCGYRVIEAATSDEAMTVLREIAPQVSAILIDAGLAGSRNAFELRLWVQEHCPGVRTVLSGSVDAAARAAGEMCDQGPHLKRPYEYHVVLAHIRRVLSRLRD